MGGSEVLVKLKYCMVLLVDFRIESGVIPDIVNSDETPTERLLTRQGVLLSQSEGRRPDVAHMWGNLSQPKILGREPQVETNVCITL